MRIAFYHSSEHWSASSRAFAAAGRGLVARGNEVKVICCGAGAARAGFERWGVETVVLPGGSSYARNTVRMRSVLKELGSDVVFVHSAKEHIIVSCAMRLGQRGVV